MSLGWNAEVLLPRVSLDTALDSLRRLEPVEFVPKTVGAVTTELNLVLKGGLHVLHVVVEHGHSDDGS